MHTSPHLRPSTIAIITAIVLVLIAVVSILIPASRDELLRYDRVKDITLQMEYPPFTSFSLSNTEINTLLDEFSSINFADAKTVPYIADGDGVTCTITTSADSGTIYFLRPYCYIGEDNYVLNRDAEIFQVIDEIVKNHSKSITFPVRRAY